MAGRPPARGYWATLPEPVQQLIAEAFRLLPFTPPTNLPTNRPIGSGKWVPAPHPAAKRALAEGSEGLVNLWCLVDSEDKITDRIIIKQVHPGAQRYSDPSNWRNGVVGGEPRESQMANAVWTALATEDRRFVQECLGWGDCKGDARWRYRLYFEYSAHGNLSECIEAQAEQEVVKTGEKRKAEDVIVFPEPFLWYLLESLAKVVVAMDEAGDGGIIHGDLHVGNIFLNAPDTARFGLYPVPKVADFGSSRSLGDLQVRNRGEVVRRDACCVLFAPPELAKINDGVTWEVREGINTTLSSKTNVWQVGMLLACCMRLEKYLPETDWRDVDRKYWEVDEAEQLRFRGRTGRQELNRESLAHEQSNYSKVLLDIVQRCLIFDSSKRPTPGVLLKEVRHLMKDLVVDLDKHHPDGVDEKTQCKKLRMRLNDKYKVGKAWAR